jgi:hypothetical protein
LVAVVGSDKKVRIRSLESCDCVVAFDCECNVVGL